MLIRVFCVASMPNKLPPGVVLEGGGGNRLAYTVMCLERKSNLCLHKAIAHCVACIYALGFFEFYAVYGWNATNLTVTESTESISVALRMVKGFTSADSPSIALVLLDEQVRPSPGLYGTAMHIIGIGVVGCFN